VETLPLLILVCLFVNENKKQLKKTCPNVIMT